MNEQLSPDTVEYIGWTLHRRGKGAPFHAVHASGVRQGSAPCGSQLNEVTDRSGLSPDCRPCCRCFNLTPQQSVTWMRKRMQTYMSELLETRRRAIRRQFSHESPPD